MKRWIVIGLLLSLVCAVACSSSTSSDSSGTSDTPTAAPDIPDIDYVAAAEAVAPSFTAPSSASVSANVTKAGGTWGWRAYEIAVIFANNAASLGSNNVYNNFMMAQNVFEDFKGLTDLADYAFTTAFAAPFFGTTAAYQYAGNYSSEEGTSGGSAISEAADSTVSVLSSSAGEASSENGEERGSIKGSYSEGTKVLSMDGVTYVDYTKAAYQGTSSGKFIMRMQVEGNADTHAFDTLKLVKYNPGAGAGGTDGYYLNIVGRGISQGAGKYFLFRIIDENGSDPIPANGGYFCVSAENLSTDTNFDTPLTESEVEGTACAEYLTAVKAMTPFSVTTDLPSQAFDTTIQGNPKEFVMVNPIPTP